MSPNVYCPLLFQTTSSVTGFDTADRQIAGDLAGTWAGLFGGRTVKSDPRVVFYPQKILRPEVLVSLFMLRIDAYRIDGHGDVADPGFSDRRRRNPRHG